MTIPNETRLHQIKREIKAARGSVTESRNLFAELQTTFGTAEASRLWWAFYGAYDAADT